MRTSDIEKSLGPDSGDLMLLSISDRRSLTLIIASTLLSPFLWSYRYELTQDLLLPLVAMSILTCIPFAQLLLSNRGLLINPATVFAASFYVNYGFSAVDNLDRTYAGLYLNPYLADGAYWAALSLAAFMLGYYLPIGRPLASFAPLISTSRGTKQAQRLFLVSAFLTAIYYLLSVFGGAFFYRFLGGFDNLALALIALIAFDPNRKPDTGIGSRIWHPFAFSLLTLIPALNSGMRGVFLIPWVMLIICWYLARRHFPWFSFFAFTLLGIYLILPVLGFYKFARRGGSSVQESLNYTIEMVEEVDFMEYSKETSDAVVNRVGTMPVFIVIIERTGREVEFLKGLTYKSFFIAFIPRFIWRGKPQMNNFSNWLTREYGIIGKGDRITSVGLGLVGEAWANFGSTGMFIVMAFYGMFFRLVYEWLMGRQSMNLISLAVFVAISLQLGQQENVFINNVTSVIKLIGLSWLILKFLPQKEVESELQSG